MVTIWRHGRLLTMTTTLLLAAGCGNETQDARLAEMAQRSLDAQDRQNERLSEHSRQIAENSKHLVEADAEARKRMAESHAALQKEIETARANVDRGREELERERREIALHRHRDPIVAQMIGVIGLTLACLLPLMLAGYVLYSVNRPGQESEALGDLLVAEIAAEEPLLLSGPVRPAAHLEDRTDAGRPRTSQIEPPNPRLGDHSDGSSQ